MLINLRNALMAGKRLPYDAEVEYLESNGTQYIDTLVNADSNLSVEITMANAGTPWSSTNPMGAILATPRARHHLNFSTSSICYYFCTGDTVTATYIKPSDGEVFTYKVDAIAKTLSVNSSTFSLPNDTFDLGMTYWLFGRNGTTPPYLGKLRICSAKLWSGATLVRDYIPVRKGTVGYLYDRVSGKLFGNAGSGDFVLGPDVVPVEYIESHGTEYIDTGMYLTTDFEYDLKFRMNTPLTSGTKSLGLQYHTWGASYPMWCIGLTTFNKPRVFANMSAGGNAATGVDVGWNYDTDITMSLHGNTLTYNSTDITFARWENSETSLATMKIFAEEVSRSGGRVLDFAYARCYFLYLYSGNDNNRKFLPVRVGTEGAMMDVLTRRIYRNAGTGAFGYGNDLKYPIPAS